MSVDVSVVIVSYNSRAVLPACLASLREHTRGVAFEAVVVDNASRDGTPGIVASDFPWAKLVQRPANGGLSAAVNDGAAASTASLIAAINPDCRFEHDVLTPLAQHLRERPDAGIVAPKLLNDDGSLQLSCRAFPGYSTALFNRYSLLTRLAPGNPYSRDYLMADFDHASMRDVDWVSGAAMMFPRAVFDRVGGWDDGFFLFNEDVDFCRRVRDAGLRVVYDPHVSLYHGIGVSESRDRRAIVERHKSMWRYYRKHLRGNAVRDAATGAGIAVRCAALLATNAVRASLNGHS